MYAKRDRGKNSLSFRKIPENEILYHESVGSVDRFIKENPSYRIIYESHIPNYCLLIRRYGSKNNLPDNRNSLPTSPRKSSRVDCSCQCQNAI